MIGMMHIKANGARDEEEHFRPLPFNRPKRKEMTKDNKKEVSIGLPSLSLMRGSSKEDRQYQIKARIEYYTNHKLLLDLVGKKEEHIYNCIPQETQEDIDKNIEKLTLSNQRRVERWLDEGETSMRIVSLQYEKTLIRAIDDLEEIGVDTSEYKAILKSVERINNAH